VSEAEESTRTLMRNIERILNDEDLDPFTAPELQYPQKVRLARLFIEDGKKLVAEGDKTTSMWLRYLGGMLDGNLGNAEKRIAAAIERGDHWKWWHSDKRAR